MSKVDQAVLLTKAYAAEVANAICQLQWQRLTDQLFCVDSYNSCDAAQLHLRVLKTPDEVVTAQNCSIRHQLDVLLLQYQKIAAGGMQLLLITD